MVPGPDHHGGEAKALMRAPSSRKPALQLVLAFVLLANALIFAAPVFAGQSIDAWEIGIVCLLGGLSAAFGIAGLKGLRSAG